MILKAIVTLIDRDRPAGVKILSDLISCARFAVQDLYNAPGKSSAIDADNVFDSVHEFVRTELGFEPIPEASTTTLRPGREARTRAMAIDRDCSIMTVKAGAMCPITGLPHAQMAHILPVSTAGAVKGHQWFWLWMAVVLPQSTFHAAWNLAGGINQHSIANVMMLSQPLHVMFDHMNVCFQPQLNKSNPFAVAYDLKLQVPRDTEVQFYNLRGLNGIYIADNEYYKWKAFNLCSQLEAPSPLLISLHRYSCYVRKRLFDRGLRLGPPPAAPMPLPSETPGNNCTLWLMHGGSSRSAPSSPRSTPSPLHGSPTGRSPSQPSPLSPGKRHLGLDGQDYDYWGFDDTRDGYDDNDDTMSELEIGPSAMEGDQD